MIGFLGCFLVLWSMSGFVFTLRHPGWPKAEGEVLNDSRPRSRVDVQLPTGQVISADNGAGRRLRPGRSIKLLLDPRQSGRGWAYHRTTPLVRATLALVYGIFLILLEVAVTALIVART